MKNKLLLWGGVAVVAYLIYKKMSKSNPTGRELAPPPVSPKPIVAKPPVSSIKNDYLPNGCPTKEKMAKTRYTEEGLQKLKQMGCI